MKFTYKSPAEIEAMSEYAREKYFDEKQKHEAEVLAQTVKDEVQKALPDAVKSAKEEMDKAVELLKGEHKVGLEARDKQLEEAKAEMNRIQVKERSAQVKGLANDIYEMFSGEEGEKALKSLVTLKKDAFKHELPNVNVKAVGNMTVSADWRGAGLVPVDQQPALGISREIFQVRNLVPVSPTQSDVIKYAQFRQGEGRIATVAAGALKPQIDYDVTMVEAPVRKIAGHITLEDEFLEDVVGARDFLAAELPQAYLEAESLQLFKGNGTGTNIKGLWEWATELILPRGGVTLASNAWDKIAAALTQVRRALRPTDAVWVSPEVYLMLLINKGNTLEYTYPIISDVNGTVRIGGVPIFQHTAFAEFEGLAGDFQRGCRIFQRKAMTIRTSTEHAENFTHNLTTILVEGRIALPVYYPEGFVKIDFTADGGAFA